MVAKGLGQAWIDAMAFYAARVDGGAAIQHLQDAVTQAIGRNGAALLPVHIRHHWVAGCLFMEGGELKWVIVDSCPSAITRTDLRRLARRFGWPQPLVTSWGRQSRETVECGLFMIRALAAASKMSKPLTVAAAKQRETYEVLDLAHWRQAIATRNFAALEKEIKQFVHITGGANTSVGTSSDPIDLTDASSDAAPRDGPSASTLGMRDQFRDAAWSAPISEEVKRALGDRLNLPVLPRPAVLKMESGPSAFIADTTIEASVFELMNQARKSGIKAAWISAAAVEDLVTGIVEPTWKVDGDTETVLAAINLNNAHFVLLVMARNGTSVVADSLIPKGKKQGDKISSGTALAARCDVVIKELPRQGFELEPGTPTYANVMQQPVEGPSSNTCALWVINNAARALFGTTVRLIARSTLEQAAKALEKADRSEALKLLNPVSGVQSPGRRPSWVPTQRPQAPKPRSTKAPRAPWDGPPQKQPHKSTKSVALPCAHCKIGTVRKDGCDNVQCTTNYDTAEQGSAPAAIVPKFIHRIESIKSTSTMKQDTVKSRLERASGKVAVRISTGAKPRILLGDVSKENGVIFTADAIWCDTCGAAHPHGCEGAIPIPSSGVSFHGIQTDDIVYPIIPSCDEDERGSDMFIEYDESVFERAMKADLKKKQGLPLSAEEEDAIASIEEVAKTREKLKIENHMAPEGPEPPRAAEGNDGRALYDTLAVGADQTLARFRRFFIHQDRPPHVHFATWNRIKVSSRRTHVRWLRRLANASGLPSGAHIAVAAVEVVLRQKALSEKGTRFASDMSALSAIACALESLPLYSDAAEGIHIKEHPAYKDAFKRFTALAKREADERVRDGDDDSITAEEFDVIKKDLDKNPGALSLALADWHFAGRMCEIRRLYTKDGLRFEACEHEDRVRVVAHVTEGKGPERHGPYDLVVEMPRPVANIIAEQVRWAAAHDQMYVWQDSHQRSVAKEIAKLKTEKRSLTIRAIRKGAIRHLSGKGVAEEDLVLLTTHRNRDTLLRYLGFGKFDGAARTAAARRASATTGGQACPGVAELVGGGARSGRPAWMGLYSGRFGISGQRAKPPPEMFAQGTPSASDLGLPKAGEEHEYTLHVKPEIGRVNLALVEQLVEDGDLKAAVRVIQRWIDDPSLLGVPDTQEVPPEEIPASKIDTRSTTVIRDAAKIAGYNRSIHGAIRSGVNGFLLKQHAKKKLRPIFETMFNKSIQKEKLPPLSYPSRAERRKVLSKAKYVWQADMSAWFDAFELSATTGGYYVVRIPGSEHLGAGPGGTWVLTRLPMGASHAPHVAQTTTWSLAEPCIKNKKVWTFTMIDNVCIAGNSLEEVEAAAKIFVERCNAANVTLNDGQNDVSRIRDDITGPGVGKATVFLGEHYEDYKVRNTEKTVTKLQAAWDTMLDALKGQIKRTKRNVCSLISLAIWMAGTMGYVLAEFFPALRVYSTVAARAGTWDRETPVTQEMIQALRPLVEPLLSNTPTGFSEILSPGVADDYDAIVFVDAAKGGWGATVLLKSGDIREVQCGWPVAKEHSAWAEPLAAADALRLIRTGSCLSSNVKIAPIVPEGRIAMVTDHQAVASAAPRWWSTCGGFSLAYPLNECMREFYARNGVNAGRGQVDVFYIAGERNPADAPSRRASVGSPLIVKPFSPMCTLPALSTCQHPHATRPARAWWCV